MPILKVKSIKPKPGILSVERYYGGLSKVKGYKKVIKLSSNESALGHSPKINQILKPGENIIFRYPDSSYKKLKSILAKKHNISEKKIFCGNGSDEIFSLICNSFLNKGDEVVIGRHAFLLYKIYSKINGAKVVFAKENNYTLSVDSILKKITRKTKILFIANPNNPTGTYIEKRKIINLLNKVPKKILVVIDEAYGEFVRNKNYTSAIPLVKGRKNVLVTRTFSKIYGLASLRIGWSYSSIDLCEILNKVRGPFNINGIAEKAAIVAIKDQKFIKKAADFNTKWISRSSKKLMKLGYKIIPSVCNFYLLKLRNKKQANILYKYLQSNGIIVRKLDAYGINDCLRVTIGRNEENITLIRALENFTKKNK